MQLQNCKEEIPYKEQLLKVKRYVERSSLWLHRGGSIKRHPSVAKRRRSRCLLGTQQLTKLHALRIRHDEETAGWERFLFELGFEKQGLLRVECRQHDQIPGQSVLLIWKANRRAADEEKDEKKKMRVGRWATEKSDHGSGGLQAECCEFWVAKEYMCVCIQYLYSLHTGNTVKNVHWWS